MLRTLPSSSLLIGLLLFSSATAQVPSYTSFANGCAGSAGVPLITADGPLPILNQTFTTRLSNVHDTGTAVGITGLSKTSWGAIALPADLTLVDMPGCTLYTDSRRQVAFAFTGGTGTWDVVLPSDLDLLGLKFYQQAFVVDASVPGLGAVMSNATEGVIGIVPLPGASILFPAAKSLTDFGDIVVRGTAHDPLGIGIESLSVNGIPASSSDGFANWQVTNGLLPGDNLLQIQVTRIGGVVNSNAASVTVSLVTPITTATLGSGPAIADPHGIALEGNRILAVDGALNAVVSIDRFSGDRTLVSAMGTGSGPNFISPSEIVVDGSRALVVDGAAQAVYAVDLASGDRSILANAVTGSGPNFILPVGIQSDGARALVADKTGKSVIAIDLASGNRTLISSIFTGSGPLLSSPDGGLALDTTNNRLLVTDSDLDAVIAVDLTSGNRTILSDISTGSGLDFLDPLGIALDAPQGRALVTDTSRKDVFAVDLSSGDRTIVSGFSTGLGPSNVPIHIVLDGSLAFISDTNYGSLQMVDLITGDRVVISK